MSIQGQLQSWYKTGKSYLDKHAYARHITLFVALIAVLGAAVFGYWWYSRQQEQQAHYVFMRGVDVLNQAMQQDSQELWQDALQTFEYGYREYPSSHYAPYFLAYQSDVLRRLGNDNESTATFEQATYLIPKNAPVYYDYAIKLALLLCDDTDVTQVERGKQMLEQLAHNQYNTARDRALFYLALRYYMDERVHEAQQLWQEIIDVFGPQSTWGQAAYAKLHHTE